MAQIEIRRSKMLATCTMGQMYGPDGEFLCHTLEDPVRNVKVPGDTAIPAGRYELAIPFSKKYGRPMPRLLEVPFYTGILIHVGNTPHHTEGCILVGDDEPNTPAFLDNSRTAFDRIFPILRKLVEKGEVFVQVNGGFEAKDWIRAVPGAVPPGLPLA